MLVDNLRAKTVALVLFSIVTIAMFSVFFFKSGQGVPLTKTPYEVTVVVPDATTLVNNADVRMAGVRVGSVRGIDLTNDGEAAVKVQLGDQAAPLAKDTRARVRLKTVLGESYLALEPGGAKTGFVPAGGFLDAANVDRQVQLDEIVSTFDGPTRKALQRSIRGLGSGVEGEGNALNRTFIAAEPVFEDGRAVFGLLARQKEDLADVVRNTTTLFRTLADRDTALRSLVRDARITAQAVRERDDELRQTVREIPPTMRRVDAVTRSFATLSHRATPVVRDLTSGARALTPTMARLGPAAAEATDFLRRVGPLTKAADPLLTELEQFSKDAPSATRALPKLLCELNPALAYLAPYSRETGSFFANVGMTTDAIDQLGRTPIIVKAAVDANSLAAFDGVARKTVDQLLNTFGVSQYQQLRFNPYPKPGTVGDRKPWDGEVPRVHSTC